MSQLFGSIWISDDIRIFTTIEHEFNTQLIYFGEIILWQMICIAKFGISSVNRL